MTNKNISIIGVGRLGICVGLCLEHAGYNVLGVDVFPDYVEKINNKTLFSPEPGVNKMLSNSINFSATTNFDEALVFSDIIFIYVATPSSGGEKFYDHTTLGNILMKINERKVQNKHIVIGCTVTPGYIREVGNFLIKDCKNTSLSYNPEFIAQGDIINGIFAADFILIGEGSKEAGNKLQEIYEKLGESYGHIPVIHRMSPASAEITKLSVNCFVTTKIAFANMIGDVADLTIGANKFDILNAVGADSRVGKKYLMPGYGFGGPCFPRDNRALGGYIQRMGIDPLIPIATDTLNTLHTKFQTQQILDKKIDTVVIIGVGYKEKCSVPIIEESAKLKIGQELVRSGIRVIVKDIKLLIDCVKLEYGNLFEYEIVESLDDVSIVKLNMSNGYILK
jgi:nucleotide sugar dehydrogenase